jgi:hypothetical protein
MRSFNLNMCLGIETALASWPGFIFYKIQKKREAMPGEHGSRTYPKLDPVK